MLEDPAGGHGDVGMHVKEKEKIKMRIREKMKNEIKHRKSI
ncbi:hypothetical protein bcere0019_55370 [Bacillus cereus Rock3-28]|nr:hypothetical protein bcere0019_55370 [Bacillus cereus Rock3-28]